MARPKFTNRPRTIVVGRNLSKREAWRRARRRPGPDFRGFAYNKRTGRARLI